MENRQVLFTISHQVMCTNLILFNAPTVMTLYIIMYTRRVKVIREGNFCVMSGLEFQIYVIFMVPAWDISTFLWKISEVVAKNIVVCFIIWIIETGFSPKVKLFFYVWVHTKNAAYFLLNLMKGGYIYIYIYLTRYYLSTKLS